MKNNEKTGLLCRGVTPKNMLYGVNMPVYSVGLWQLLNTAKTSCLSLLVGLVQPLMQYPSFCQLLWKLIFGNIPQGSQL